MAMEKHDFTLIELFDIKSSIEEIPIETIKEILGLNEVKPIPWNGSTKDEDDGDHWADLYEFSLRETFERFIDHLIDENMK